MSFNLAFWTGKPPRNDVAAAVEFERLYELHMGEAAGDEPVEQSPELLAFIRDITSRYPDLTDLSDDEIDDGVWSDGPLADNARGPLLYLGITWSRVEEVVPFLVERARGQRLVVFDPQNKKLL